jgi:UDP-N-acetylmuramyl tripeptide synthase
MKKMRLFISVIVGKATAFFSRLLRYGGSSFPGRIGLKIHPKLIEELVSRLEGGVTLITATNGKTSITRKVVGLLRQAGYPVVTNASGANMVGGVASALLKAVSWTLSYPRHTFAVLEIDEGSLPLLLPRVRARIVFVGNLYRDQLDRYGDTASLLARIDEGLRRLSRDHAPHLVLNADDPYVATLARDWQGGHTFFGIEPGKDWNTRAARPAARQFCVFCGAFLEYTSVTIAHCGVYSCTGCAYAHPEVHYRARGIGVADGDIMRFSLVLPEGEEYSARLSIPGLYGVYNALGAVSVFAALGHKPDAAALAWLGEFKPPFGRFEKIMHGQRPLYLILIKNAAGVDATLDTITRFQNAKRYLILLSDREADGRDISWIYDAEFELLQDVERVVTSGSRGAALALRLVLAGLPESAVLSEPDMGRAFLLALESSGNAEEPLFILSSYTAMYDFRPILAAQTGARSFWKEDA